MSGLVSKPSFRYIACSRGAPISSAMRAVAMFDEWISVSGMFSQRFCAWSSLILNRPTWSGAVASKRRAMLVTTPVSIAVAIAIGLNADPSS